MIHKPTHWVDQQSSPVASLDVQFQGDHFEGMIVLDSTPPQLRRLFE